MIVKRYQCECPICHREVMAKGKLVNGAIEIEETCSNGHKPVKLVRTFANAKVSTSMATSEDSRYFEEQMLHSNPAIMRRDPLEESDLGVQESNRRL